MWTASRPKPVGEAPEVHLVDGIEHLHDGPLDDLVFQRGNTERPLPPVRLRDVRAPARFRPVAPCLHPRVQVLKTLLQVLPVVGPRHPVHPRSRPGLTWCSSAVNRASLSRRATSRTRPSALDASVPALCPGCVLLSVFPLARLLPSPTSATASTALFDRFAGTTRRSDFPRSFILGLPPQCSPSGPPNDQLGGRTWDLPVLAHGGSVHALVL